MKTIFTFILFVSFFSVAEARKKEVVGSINGCLEWSQANGCTLAQHCTIYSNGSYSCQEFEPWEMIAP